MEITMNGTQLNFKSKRFQGAVAMIAAFVLGLVNQWGFENGHAEIINTQFLESLKAAGLGWFGIGAAHAITKGK